MKEHQSVPHEEPGVGVSRDMSLAQGRTWNPAEIGRALNVSPTPRDHAGFGQGFDYQLGDDPEAGLTIYPEDNNVHYISGDVVLGFYEIGAPILRSDVVIFESRTPKMHTSLVVKDTGEVTFISAKAPKADPWDSPDSTPNGLRAPEQATDGLTIDSPVPVVQDTTSEHETSSNTKETAEKDPRVNVVGRAGRDPRVSETKNGTLIAKFPLAEHLVDEEGNDQTKWHNVVAFKTRAAEVAKTVTKGGTYRVVGYLHEKPGKNGKIEQEIYAVAVKPPSAKSKSATE